MLNFETSVCSLIWLTCSTFVSIGGILVAFPPITPHFICNLFVFGKSRKRTAWKLKPDELFLLPKRWFYHFYASGVVNALFWAAVLTTKHWTGEIPNSVNDVIQFMRYPLTDGSGDLVPCSIVLTCIGIQVTRRCIECLTISVYSKDGTMSVAIYLVGVGFYIGLPMSCVAGSNLSKETEITDISTYCGISQVIGLSMFIYGTLLQHWTTRQFAKMRCNKKGVVVNDRHHIPSGGMFEYVSSPHYMAEILIYTSMAVTFSFQNSMMNYLVIFVIANQIVSAHYTHKWYKENFPKYPVRRKAIIPYLY